MDNPMTSGAAATPSGGGRHVGMRRRIVSALRGQTICDECGCEFPGDHCPACAQRRRHRAGLEVGVETFRRDWGWVTLDRADDLDGEGWDPTGDDGLGDDEPGGWPW